MGRRRHSAAAPSPPPSGLFGLHHSSARPGAVKPLLSYNLGASGHFDPIGDKLGTVPNWIGGKGARMAGLGTYAVKADRFLLAGRGARGGYLFVSDGKFGAWQAERPDCEVVDFPGCWVAPGLVDTHIHGFAGTSTSDIDPAGLNAASVELARRGTTSWLPTTFTDSVERIGAACAAVLEAEDARGADFAGARMPGIYLEGPFFTQKHVGAQNPAYLMDPSVEVFDEWQRRARGRIVKSALAPERAGSGAYIAALRERGVVCCIGHSDASYEQALAGVDAGATCFVHTYNGMRGLHHRDPGIVGCAMTTPGTYAEVICDGRHVAPAALDALVRAKGWQHTVLITDCLGCGGMPEGEYLSGGLPVELRGGLCYLAGTDTIAGSVLTLVEGVRNVVDWGVATAEQALRMATEVPARSAGVDGVCGRILPGRAADFIVLDAGLNLQRVYLAGIPLG